MLQGKKMIQPPFLKAGDKVALVSPAYWVPEGAPCALDVTMDKAVLTFNIAGQQVPCSISSEQPRLMR